MRTSAGKRIIHAKQSKRTRGPAATVSAGDSLYAKGISAAADGRHDLAAALFSQAIQIAGPVTRYCHGLAVSLHASAKYRQAAVCYRQALLGDRANAQLYVGLARALMDDGRLVEALTVLKHAVAVRPEASEVWALLGGALSLHGNSELALEALRQATALDSTQAGFHYDMGLVLGKLGKAREAESAYRQALRLNGRFPEALNNLGNLLRRRSVADEAVACFRRALRYRPDYPDATYNLGLAFQDLDLLEEAEACYRIVLARRPDHHAANNNLANVFLGMGRIDDALRHYDAALQLSPENRSYLVNLGIAQLLTGNFREGWGNYARRPAPSLPGVPLWGGESIRGLSILLLSEQGFGDTLQFIRYARHLRCAGGRVRAICPAPLAELLRSVPGLESVTVTGQQPPPCDRYAPLMNLPGMFGTRPDTIPAETPYLSADPERVRQWGLSLVVPRSHFKVGVAWRGGAEHWNDRNRSLDPVHLAGLEGLADISWISLQEGSREGCASLPFSPLKRDLDDFADTAALIANLDLVISVDTSVAHLAGALARPCWTLLPFASDWRWMGERTDSPWYPGMKLFRQKRRGDWGKVIEDVRRELINLRTEMGTTGC